LAGAAAGLSAVFKAPLTGVLFALEIPYQQDLAKEALIPATIASIVAYFTSINFLGFERIFPIISGIVIPSYSMLLHSIVLGLIAAVLGILFVIVNEGLKRLNGKLWFKPFSSIFLGGLLIGFIGFICPQVLGLGYGTIEGLINGIFFNASILFILSIILLKILTTSITLNMGGSGGLFVPSIYVGAALGALYSKCVLNTPNEIIVMAAMAALIASTNKTMLASIAFVAETTGPSSIITTMIAASVAYFISGRFSFFKDVQPQRRLVEEEKAINILYHTVIKKGRLDYLKSIKVSQIMTKDPVVLQEMMSIGEAISIIKSHNYRIYPVVSSIGVLLGHVEIDEILKIPEEKRNMTVGILPLRKPLIVTEEEDVSKIFIEMIEQGMDHVYVVSDYSTMKLKGVVAEIDLMKRII